MFSSEDDACEFPERSHSNGVPIPWEVWFACKNDAELCAEDCEPMWFAVSWNASSVVKCRSSCVVKCRPSLSVVGCRVSKLPVSQDASLLVVRRSYVVEKPYKCVPMSNGPWASTLAVGSSRPCEKDNKSNGVSNRGSKVDGCRLCVDALCLSLSLCASPFIIRGEGYWLIICRKDKRIATKLRSSNDANTEWRTAVLRVRSRLLADRDNLEKSIVKYPREVNAKSTRGKESNIRGN